VPNSHGGPTRGGLKFSKKKVLALLIISIENKEFTVNSNGALYFTYQTFTKNIYFVCGIIHALVFRIYILIPFFLDNIEVNNFVNLS
jgi:hypothetical protein